MKKTITLFLIALFLLQIIAVSASSTETKQIWQDKRELTKQAQTTHNDAKIKYAAEKTEENRQEVIETGKELLNNMLNEAEAWLDWKKLEAEENSLVSEEIKTNIYNDVEKNLEKINELRSDVNGVQNEIQLGLVSLKMVGKYLELLSDVARNTGYLWVDYGNNLVKETERYESKLRDVADDNSAVIEKLDLAKAEIENAKSNINNAKMEYDNVKLPGTPLIKFNNGNNYLKIAHGNLLSCQVYLNQAYLLIKSGGQNE